ncbi:MAG TPA: F0F1 ATP synthase subunit A [Candidatus Eisenbacteria bacterium]|nr:F0F1 ATP synthase subunit A [Candidatus Eisenbacteria bacterium]
MAASLVALWLPSDPNAALSVAAGQIVTAVNFFFLSGLVKLFTRSWLADDRAARDSMRARAFFLGAAKLTVVYGGVFALSRWRGLQFLPLVLGLSLPLIAIVLKSIMLALGLGAGAGEMNTRRATSTASPSGSQAKLAALLLLAGLLALPVLAMAQAPDHGSAPAATQSAEPAPGDAAHTEASHAGEAAHTEESHAAEGAAAEGHGGGEHKEGGEAHLPNWVTMANDYFPDNPVVRWMHENEYLVFAWLAGAVFLVLTMVGMKRDAKVPGHLQNAIEWIVESMEDVCGGMLGKHLPKYFPFIMSIFFYILMMNLIGIVPGFKSSTSTIDVTLALALVTFVYVQISGLINLGPLGYLDHLAGSPRDIVGFAMLPVMIPVHLLGEMVKPVSLSCRLFGNIFGEDTLIVVFVGVAALCLKASLLALAVPPMAGITALFMLLQTLTAIVQALIFSLLTTVYLYMMIPHESHAHEEGGHAH